MDAQLRDLRVEAALASAGGSSEPIYSALLKEFKRVRARGRVLDFGAGAGELAHRLIEAPDVSSVDAADLIRYRDAVDPRIRWHTADLNAPLPMDAGAYDTIVASEIIEHLENPYSVAREWLRLLKPSGHLVCSTPNNESLRSVLALVQRGHFVAFSDSCYPAHITALVRKDLTRILTAAGFVDVTFSYTDDGGIPKLPSLKWQQISRGLLERTEIFRQSICSAQKPVR